MARPGPERRGTFGQGTARLGAAGEAGRGLNRRVQERHGRRGMVGSAWQGQARSGAAGEARPARARPGMARLGLAGVAAG